MNNEEAKEFEYSQPSLAQEPDEAKPIAGLKRAPRAGFAREQLKYLNVNELLAVDISGEFGEGQ